MSIYRDCVIAFSCAMLCLSILAPAWCDSPGTSQTCKILFIGDTSFGENYQLANREHGQPNILEEKGYDYPLARLKPLLMQADLVIANLETPVTNLPTSPVTGKKDYVHWTDVVLAPKHLKAHNIHTVSLANNHTLDYGVPGLEQTLDILRKSEIAAFGAGRNQQEAARPFVKDLPVGGRVFKLAVFGAFEFFPDYDRQYHFYASADRAGAHQLALDKLAAEIARLKAAEPATYVVVFPHWGENYVWKSKSQTDLAHGLVDAGADLVIGHGAHMIQEIEPYRGRWIIYSLGNFMFNSPGRYKLKGVDPYSLAAELVVRADGDRLSKSIRVYPIFTDNQITNYQSRLLAKAEFDRAGTLLAQKCPDPARFRQQVRAGKDNLGYYLEFATP
jgi:hypothetical protein